MPFHLERGGEIFWPQKYQADMLPWQIHEHVLGSADVLKYMLSAASKAVQVAGPPHFVKTFLPYLCARQRTQCTPPNVSDILPLGNKDPAPSSGRTFVFFLVLFIGAMTAWDEWHLGTYMFIGVCQVHNLIPFRPVRWWFRDPGQIWSFSLQQVWNSLHENDSPDKTEQEILILSQLHINLNQRNAIQH